MCILGKQERTPLFSTHFSKAVVVHTKMASGWKRREREFWCRFPTVLLNLIFYQQYLYLGKKLFRQKILNFLLFKKYNYSRYIKYFKWKKCVRAVRIDSIYAQHTLTNHSEAFHPSNIFRFSGSSLLTWTELFFLRLKGCRLDIDGNILT